MGAILQRVAAWANAGLLCSLLVVCGCGGVHGGHDWPLEKQVRPGTKRPLDLQRRSGAGLTAPPEAALSDVTQIGSSSPVALERRVKAWSPLRRQTPFSQPTVPRSQTRAIVLMYHGISHSSATRTVFPWNLEEQILRLRQNGTEIIRLSTLVAFLRGHPERLPARVAVLTIDDGEASFLKHAYPVLLKHRAYFALGIITRVAALGASVRGLDWQQLRTMLGSGLCELASHGHNHIGMARLSEPELSFELTHSRDLIELNTGVRPEVFVYPLGSVTRKVAAAARRTGYLAALTAVGASIDADVWPFKIPRFGMTRTTTLEAMHVFFDAAVATAKSTRAATGVPTGRGQLSPARSRPKR